MFKFCVIFLLLVALGLMTPLAIRTVFFRMPYYSSSFDCDDGALLMVERLEYMGITATPFLGNLKIAGETYQESDHVWVLSEIAGRQIALDRGVFCFDGQHYEGFPISREQLQEFVTEDLELAGQTVGNPAGR